MSTGTESGSQALNLEKCSVVLLDVAGTTTSINFVKDTLFQYVTKQADEFLKAQWENETVKEAIKDLKDAELDLAGAIAAVKELTEQNGENKGLKTIQGLIYKKGYEDGDLKAHVFSDVPSCLEAWAKSRKVAIYSTGSVESQKLLFGHTSEGDVSGHITKYFDQSVGKKIDSGSYEKIAKELEVKTEEIVFVTDNTKEAEAAKTAGLTSILVRREGNEEIPEDTAKTYHVVSSFKDIVFENPGKRKNEDETSPTEEQPPAKLAKTDAVEDKAAPTEVPVKDAPQQEEKMEVDASTKSESEANAEKPDAKPSEEDTKNNKTEMDSNDDKTEPTSTTEQKKPEKVEETPMETEKIEENSKPDETDAKKEETATVKEDSKEEKTKVAEGAGEAKEKAVEKDESDDQTEKMEAEETSEPASNNEAPTKETVKAANEEEKINEKQKTEVDAKEKETKEPASEVEMKEEITNGKKEEKVADQKTEEKKTETPEKPEEKVVSGSEDGKEETPKAAEVADKVEESKEKVETTEEVKPEEASSKVEAESNGSEAESAEPEKKTEEKTDSSEACPKEEKPEASTSDAGAKAEEKENKSELANGVENGESEKTEAVNGDAEEKRNGDAKSEESDSKVDDIKVKKIEESPDSTPAVSVEV